MSTSYIGVDIFIYMNNKGKITSKVAIAGKYFCGLCGQEILLYDYTCRYCGATFKNEIKKGH